MRRGKLIRFFKNIAGLALFLLAGAVLLSGCATFSPKEPATPVVLPDGVIAIAAKDLFAYYTDDAKAADVLFKGKTLQVTGYLTMNRDFMGARMLVLSAGRGSMWNIAVQALFSDTSDPRLATLKIGTEVKVIGPCQGLEMDVILKDCRLAD